MQIKKGGTAEDKPFVPLWDERLFKYRILRILVIY